MEDDMDDIFDEQLEIKQLFNLDMIEEWQMRWRMCLIQLICYIVHAMHLLTLEATFCRAPSARGIYGRDQMREQLMSNLLNSDKCHDVLRMSPFAFLHLCEKLRATGKVRDSSRATVKEQVAKFLHILAHNVKNRVVSFYFHRSGEIISHHFHNVLRAIISMEDVLLVQSSGLEVPPHILNSRRFYPYFKDCVGAIDVTHMQVKVPKKDAPRFRGRKDFPTQNVLAACSFDMKFTYVLFGWEGTASDSRVLKHALTKRGDKLRIPRGKYYLGDAGFPLKSGVLTPYRGVRYHLKEYSMRGPQNAKELFNHRHASLRTVIERSFGVLKKRCPIIANGTEPYYSFETMTNITIACCILHNFLMDIDLDERLIEEVDRELLHSDMDDHEDHNARHTEDDYRHGLMLRENIATRMWDEYEAGLA